jgi:UPF0271 protein
MGESHGATIIGQDENLMPYITSCNIACGFHGGDPFHIEKTILLALTHGVKIGAHPSYPDSEGFGRRKMKIDPHELVSIIRYQIAALKGVVESLGGKLSYVKPHGALYNKASIDSKETECLIEAIRSIDVNLPLMGLARSVMETVSLKKEMPFIAEAFCDRRYEIDGTLRSRTESGAVISNVDEAINQVRSIMVHKKVELNSGEVISINAQSICVHGDNPMAFNFLKGIKKLKKELNNEG